MPRVVVQVDVPQPRGHGGHPFQRRHPADEGVGMAHVQAQAQPGVVHLAGNVRQQPGLRLHDVFQGDGHIRRQLPQKLPPEEHRLLHIPLREVHLGHEAPVDDEPPHSQVLGQVRRLPVALFRHLPHQRVDGAGGQLRKGGVEPEAVKLRHIRADGGQHRRVLQIGGIAECRDLQPQPVFPGQLRRPAVNAGQIQTVPQGFPSHMRFPLLIRYATAVPPTGPTPRPTAG